MYLTRLQREAVKRIFDRGDTSSTGKASCDRRSYLEFRRTVEGLIGGQGCVMVPCGRIWFGIETDGYTHT